MTDHDAEVFRLLRALGDAINAHNWPDAQAIHQQLLNLYSPLATMQPELARVLRRNADLVAAAGRQTSKIH